MNYLPRFPINIDEALFPDLYQWRMAFHSDNSPAVVSFKGREVELAEALRDVDFGQPFDSVVAQRIRSHFSAKPRVAANVDADLMIQGELGELPE
ncbi:hypothetical protein [Limnoglobus roseus]|uniref:hypothetical protein n=1 Tax=Limnoglobus roseus TaxID=2598579 RepID=UPI0011EB562D|nr:hypothetical protein [Limnoglobus roseus]